MSDIYVVVIEDGGMGEELVLETETQHASLEKAQARAENLKSSYGKTRIARLVFIDPDKPVMGKIVQIVSHPGGVEFSGETMALDENGALWEMDYMTRTIEDDSVTRSGCVKYPRGRVESAPFWNRAKMNTEPEWPEE